jgi:hypothetical protein
MMATSSLVSKFQRTKVVHSPGVRNASRAATPSVEHLLYMLIIVTAITAFGKRKLSAIFRPGA